MALPKIQHPLFDLTIPSTKQKIKFRPFLVKEEKILLLAQESNNIEGMVHAIKQIISNCVVEDIKVDKLPSFDIEYIFIQIRANSVGETAKLQITDKELEKPLLIDVDLREIKVHWQENHKQHIDVTNDVSIDLKYPTYDDVLKLSTNKENNNQEGPIADQTFEMITNCIDKVYSGDNQETIHELKDYTDDESKEFLESLPSEAFKEIQLFFDTMPKLQHTIEYKVKDKIKKHTFSGINDFFI